MLLGYFAVKNSADQQNLLQELIKDASFKDQILIKNSSESFEVVSMIHRDLKSLEDDSHAYDTSSHWHLFFSGVIFNLDEFSVQESLSFDHEVAGVLLSNFLKSGESLFNRINGSFAIVLFNSVSRELIFVKDQVGTVPLSVARIGSTVFFSFDSNSLARVLFSDQEIDPGFLKSMCYDYERNYSNTPQKHLIKVLPGHYLRVDLVSAKQHQYWFPELVKQKTVSQNDAITKLKSLLIDAVEQRCDDRYFAGAHMSGGLDSSLMAVLSKRFYANQKNFYAFSWSPQELHDSENLAYDERDMIRKQCNATGLHPVFLSLGTDDYHHFVSEWRSPSEYFFEQPVRKKAKKLGVNLLISGWGGDEFIGLRDEALMAEFRHKFQIVKLLKLLRKHDFKAKISSIVNDFLLPSRRRPYLKYKINPKVFKYLNISAKENKLSSDQRLFFQSLKDFQKGLINYHHLAQRCEDWYLAGQRMGLVYRYPMLDVRIIEYVLSLPVDAFYSEKFDRPLIRELASEYLIDEIWQLSKQGDPATMMNAKRIQAEAINLYITQLSEFRKNSYLSFVDFDKIKRDLSERPLNKELKYLIHKIKTVHEFTTNWRIQP